MKMKLLPTKHSPWLQKAKEDGMKLQQAFSNKEAPAGNLSTGPSCTFRKSNIPVSAPDNSSYQDMCNSCKDGSPGNDIDYPSATVEMEVAGNELTSSSWDLRYGSMMSLYMLCRSILKAALSAISLNISA